MTDPDSYTTKTGKVLTNADIEALADEAERGYDVSHLIGKENRAPRSGSQLALVLASAWLANKKDWLAVADAALNSPIVRRHVLANDPTIAEMEVAAREFQEATDQYMLTSYEPDTNWPVFARYQNASVRLAAVLARLAAERGQE